MSIRFGISTMGSTRPRLVRCRKFDWTFEAIWVTSLKTGGANGNEGAGSYSARNADSGLEAKTSARAAFD
jgi:hypothetical protein